MRIIPVEFLSQGQRCSADLYLPEGKPGKPPLVIMAHGFAAEKAFGLKPFAAHFVENGLAVLVFDYRGFGQSEGTPRTLVHPKKQLEDWNAAIDYALDHPEVDGSRLALWGTSLGGGHALVSASRRKEVSAVVAQVPHVDFLPSIKVLGVGFAIQSIPHILQDLLRAGLRLSPHTVPVVSDRDGFAALNTPECFPGYTAMIPEGVQWNNAIPARSLLHFGFYRPVRVFKKITCPVLIQAGIHDSLIPISAVREAGESISNLKLEEYPISHFDIYKGEAFQAAIAKQVQFLLDNFVRF